MRSLRSRLLVLWLLSLLACAAVGVLLVQLYARSTSAQAGQAEAVVARACDLIRDHYAFYTTDWHGPVPPLSDAGLRRSLAAVVTLALVHEKGVEGGLWQAEAGPLAYAYPTYAGGGPKLDIPAAEQDRIRAANERAAREEQPEARQWGSRSEALLLQACPLGGPIPDLTAWAMTRVRAAPGYARLRLGLGVLLALVLASSGWLTRLVMVWSRHVRTIEEALAQSGPRGGSGHDPDSIPVLRPTGERELDRIITALNESGRRLAASRRRSDELAARVTAAERLAALGRVAAGVAHEIRNPLAAMRLRAENALAAGDDTRLRRALVEVLAQVARLNALVTELLAMTQKREARPVSLDLADFLTARIEQHREEAAGRGVALTATSRVERACLDPEIVGRILDNLLLNAIRHTPEGGRVAVGAEETREGLRITVADTGPGIAPELRGSLFEPFVTGRADGTGLGLAIARELADAHGGRLSLLRAVGETPGEGAVFALDLPQPALTR